VAAVLRHRRSGATTIGNKETAKSLLSLRHKFVFNMRSL
jgi:hypothetical protein